MLEEAGRRGFLGPRAVADHAAHALGFAEAWEATAGPPPAVACDLGSGGGVPGLVLAVVWAPSTAWVLLDAMGKRCAFLEEAVETLGLGARVQVACGRAEQLGRIGSPLRSAADLVTSRGFGPPATTAEAGAALLREGGRLIVSEPPDSVGARWDTAGCATVGLEPEQVIRAAGASFMVLQQRTLPPDRYPRAPKAQTRAPLF